MTDVVETTRATYDLIAPEYARRWGSPAAWAVQEADRLAALLPVGGRVADVGCGPGQHTRLLADRGLQAWGFDLSREMLAAGGAERLVQADMRHLPLRPTALDAVWCMAALLHVPRADVPAVLAEFARVIRPGGQLVLSVAEGDGEGWEKVPHLADGRRWYVRHRLAPLTAALAAAGFVVSAHSRRTSHRDWLMIRARFAAGGEPVLRDGAAVLRAATPEADWA